MITPSRGFASDNNAGIHPVVLKAIEDANQGHVVGYGNDAYTLQAVESFKKLFGQSAEIFFVFGGTAANVLGLKACTQPYNAIICAQSAHINVNECGAIEQFGHCKLLLVPTADGKITVDQVKNHLHGIGDPHHVQPKVISITQPTELGTLYTPAEVKALGDFAHANGLLLHMDGARIANATVALGGNVRAFTVDAGVDVLSFGGTKNGMMGGEAIVFLNPALAHNFKFTRMQGMQLNSKMRFVAAQFNALLTDDLWLKNAAHANTMAWLLAEKVRTLPGVTLTQKVQTNAIFAHIPQQVIKLLQEKFFFYVWNEETAEVRWVTSFDTQEEDIAQFIGCLREIKI